MKIYLIRLKCDPTLYVGKENVSYAFISDKKIGEYKKIEKSRFKTKTPEEIVKDLGYFCLVPRKKAKLWDDPKNIIWLHTYVGGQDDFDKKNTATFSQYEVEIDDNGKITLMSLDDFVKQERKSKKAELKNGQAKNTKTSQ